MTENQKNDGPPIQNQARAVLCLCRDLMFYSKIRAASAAAGVSLKSLRDPEKLADEIGSGLIVDLNQPGALEAAIIWRLRTGRPVVGFVSHVDTDTISAARAGGIDRVLARSQFEPNLPPILTGLATSAASGSAT